MQYPQYEQPIFQQREPDTRVNFAWISEAFGLFKEQAGTWIMSILIGVVGIYYLYMFAALAADFSMADMPAQIMMISLPLFVFTGYLLSGFLRMAVRQVRGEFIVVDDLFRGWLTTPRLLGLYFMQILVANLLMAPLYWNYFDMMMYGAPSATGRVVLGFDCLFCAFTIGVLGGLVVPAYILVADGEKVFRAISRSVTAMRRDWPRAAGLWFVFGMIGAASVIPCGLGLLVTLPMGALILALLYRDMLGLPGAVPQQYTYVQQAEGSWPPPPSL